MGKGKWTEHISEWVHHLDDLAFLEGQLLISSIGVGRHWHGVVIKESHEDPGQLLWLRVVVVVQGTAPPALPAPTVAIWKRAGFCCYCWPSIAMQQQIFTLSHVHRNSGNFVQESSVFPWFFSLLAPVLYTVLLTWTIHQMEDDLISKRQKCKSNTFPLYFTQNLLRSFHRFLLMFPWQPFSWCLWWSSKGYLGSSSISRSHPLLNFSLFYWRSWSLVDFNRIRSSFWLWIIPISHESG